MPRSTSRDPVSTDNCQLLASKWNVTDVIHGVDWKGGRDALNSVDPTVLALRESSCGTDVDERKQGWMLTNLVELRPVRTPATPHEDSASPALAFAPLYITRFYPMRFARAGSG